MGNVVGFYFGRRYGVILQSREAIYEALVKKSSHFASRPTVHSTDTFNPQHNGIIDRQYGDAFRKYHQLSLTILREFGFGKGVMESRINAEVRELVGEVKELNGRPFNPQVLITSSVMNIISSILFGRRFDRFDPKLDELITYVNKFVTDSQGVVMVDVFPALRFLPMFRRRLKNIGHVQDCWLALLQEKVAQCLAKRDDEVSFVSRFCDIEGPQYDSRELLYILRDLTIAGAETSSTSLRWAVALLANHVDIQKRMQDELDSVIPAGRLPSLEDRLNLPYTEAVILEVMRYKTILPVSVPRATTQNTQVCGYFIPAGTMVFPNLYAAHMDPRVWSDPTTFRPDRFLSTDGQQVVGRERVISFSLGKRSCLGEILARQEIFLFLAGLVQHFDFQPPEGQDAIDCHEITCVTLAPRPYDVRLIPRKN